MRPHGTSDKIFWRLFRRECRRLFLGQEIQTAALEAYPQTAGSLWFFTGASR
jgi:hypothetical protein